MSTAVATRPSSGTLYDVVDLILDKGLVIDAFVRVSLVGIELLTVDVRVVVASVDTYLHFAEAANRLDLASGRGQGDGLSNLTGALGGVGGGLPTAQVEDAIQGGAAKLQQASELAESAQGTIGGAAQSAQAAAGGAAQSAQEAARGAAQSAQHTAEGAAESAQDTAGGSDEG